MMPVLIPGPKQPSNNIDVYLKPLIEDLLLLWKEEGVRMWDAHVEEHFCRYPGTGLPPPTVSGQGLA